MPTGYLYQSAYAFGYHPYLPSGRRLAWPPLQTVAHPRPIGSPIKTILPINTSGWVFDKTGHLALGIGVHK
jgi:hypothetical protein